MAEIEGRSMESVEIPKYNRRAAVLWSWGREFKLTKTLIESVSTDKVFVYPGNPWTAKMEGVENSTLSYNGKTLEERRESITAILDDVIKNNIWLLVVWPENPLADGIVDMFYERGMDKDGFSILGPDKAATMLESSKWFTKDICTEYWINTAKYKRYKQGDHISSIKGYATKLLNQNEYWKVVIKADGLAAGKWVIVAESREEAHQAIESVMLDKKYGNSEVVIEEYLHGEEVSITAIVDRNGEYRVLASSQDHKRVWEGDTGDNTGGMWAYAPADHIMTPEMLTKVKKNVIEPLLKAMKDKETPFTGFLYAGLMITKDDKTGEEKENLIEINTRFGDPETQVVLPLLPEGIDFAETLHAAANGNLKGSPELNQVVDDVKKYVATTVVCANGYPVSNGKGFNINVPEISEEDLQDHDVEIVHAGTWIKEWKLVGAGWRLLSITASAKSVKEAVAITKKYAKLLVDGSRDTEWAVEHPEYVWGDGNTMFYRWDIWHRAGKAANAGK